MNTLCHVATGRGILFRTITTWMNFSSQVQLNLAITATSDNQYINIISRLPLVITTTPMNQYMN